MVNMSHNIKTDDFVRLTGLTHKGKTIVKTYGPTWVVDSVSITHSGPEVMLRSVVAPFDFRWVGVTGDKDFDLEKIGIES